MNVIRRGVLQYLPVGRIPKPRNGSGERVSLPQARLRLRLERPDRQTAVLIVGGEVDSATADRLEEMVAHRLRSELALVVLDLSRVGFLGVAGIHALLQARRYAEQVGTALVVVTGGNRPVERALAVTAVQHQLRLHPGPVAEALAFHGDGPVGK